MPGNVRITTDGLAAALGRPELRIFDCTTYLEATPPGSEDPYTPVSGLRTFEAAHIPGADYLELQGEFSDPTTRLRFMLPAVPQLEAAFGRHGVGEGTSVVLYSIGGAMWATRFWWMLRALGHDDVAVLDGGLDKWVAEWRPVQQGKSVGYPATAFTAAPRPGLFVGRQQVLAALGAPDNVIVNALSPQFHAGREPSRYGRPGRIPGSVNVPAASLARADTRELATPAEAAAKFASQGVTKDKNVICYCGGGISATVDLLLLHELGYERLALYDGSMGEWARDPALPIETG
jgi:thiosulfate/3-mercaptopyruvate sulfurtransferase